LDPRLFGREQGQAQMLEFISSGGATVIDPDGPGPIWEVPIANPRNLDCTRTTSSPRPACLTRPPRGSAEGLGGVSPHCLCLARPNPGGTTLASQPKMPVDKPTGQDYGL